MKPNDKDVFEKRWHESEIPENLREWFEPIPVEDYPATGPTICDVYGGPGTTACAAEWLWTHKAEGYDTILADAKTVPTRPGTSSKHHEGDGSQRPEYAKARMVRTGTPTNVYCEWLPGRAIMLDLDPNCENLHKQRLDECFNSLSPEPGKPTPVDAPLFAEAAE